MAAFFSKARDRVEYTRLGECNSWTHPCLSSERPRVENTRLGEYAVQYVTLISPSSKALFSESRDKVVNTLDLVSTID